MGTVKDCHVLGEVYLAIFFIHTFTVSHFVTFVTVWHSRGLEILCHPTALTKAIASLWSTAQEQLWCAGGQPELPSAPFSLEHHTSTPTLTVIPIWALDSPLDTSCSTWRTSLPRPGPWHWVLDIDLSDRSLVLSFRDSLTLRRNNLGISIHYFHCSSNLYPLAMLLAGKPDVVGLPPCHIGQLPQCFLCILGRLYLFSAFCQLSERQTLCLYNALLLSLSGPSRDCSSTNITC